MNAPTQSPGGHLQVTTHPSSPGPINQSTAGGQKRPRDDGVDSLQHQSISPAQLSHSESNSPNQQTAGPVQKRPRVRARLPLPVSPSRSSSYSEDSQHQASSPPENML